MKTEEKKVIFYMEFKLWQFRQHKTAPIAALRRCAPFDLNA